MYAGHAGAVAGYVVRCGENRSAVTWQKGLSRNCDFL